MDPDALEDDHCNVQVCVRLKPLSDGELRNGAKRCAIAHENSVILGTKDPKIFTFDAVADESSAQEEIFAMVGKHIAESCMSGYNGSIFAYGQTGSGKTHTIQGAMTPTGGFLPGMKGLIPRVLDHMYFLMDQSEKTSRGAVRFECRCSFLEIYKEKIMDLLNPTTLDLSIREDIKRGSYVENLTEQPVSSTEEALDVLRIGAANRHVASTECNAFSSRSHSVFTITIKSKEEKENGVVKTRYSRLNLIDLAGSERQKLSKTKGEQLKEAGSINKSLTLLGNVIRALVEVAGGKNRHVPYRDSKLTFLLKDSLGGNSKTTIIATVSPSDIAFAETLSTLKRAKLIQNKAVVNQDLDGGLGYAQYAQLQKELKRVRDQLAVEKARNMGRSAKAQDGEETQMDSSLSMVSHNASFRTNKRNDHATTLVQNEHVRRLEALLNQLKSYETIEDERRRLRESNAHLKEQCASKDKYIHSARLIIRLREAAIEALQKKTSRTGRSEMNALKQEIEHLRAMVENHPDLLKHARNSHNRKKKLKEYKRLFGDNMKIYWEEVGKAQYLAKELSTYLDRVKRNGQESVSYEAVLSSPVAAPAPRKRVGWSDEQPSSGTADVNPMNWSLVPKQQKRVDASEGRDGGPTHKVVARDSRKSIAWFNHEYEEEHSWDLEDTTPLDQQNSNGEEKNAENGANKGQMAAIEDVVQGLEDKLQEEQIIRNQVERLLEEEKIRFSLELANWKSELAEARQQIDVLVDEKNSLSSDLTVKNERLRSLNKNLMEKVSSSSSAALGTKMKIDSGDDEEFRDWEEAQNEEKSFYDDSGDEPVSLRRLTMGVGLLRRANAAAQDKCDKAKLANKKKKKRMGSYGGALSGDFGEMGSGGDSDEGDCIGGLKVAKKTATNKKKHNINEVRMLDLERRLAEKEREIERLQDKFSDMKEEYEVLIEEKKFREEEEQQQQLSESGSTSSAQSAAAQFVHEIEEMERKMKERNLEYEREVMQLKEGVEDKHREWEVEKQERDERERQLIASLDTAERERAAREVELDDLRMELNKVRKQMREEISGYVSKMEEMARLFVDKRTEMENDGKKKADELLGRLEEVQRERDEAREHIRRQSVEQAEANQSRLLAAKEMERLDSDVQEMKRLNDSQVARLRHEIDERVRESEKEKERRDQREREIEEAKTKALEDQRTYYEEEINRIKEEMARQWAEWENQGKEGERETKGMILRLNEEKEELIARSRRERDEMELEHQRTKAYLDDQLRVAIEAAQAKETSARRELAIVEERLAAAESTKADFETELDDTRRALEQQIAELDANLVELREEHRKEKEAVLRLNEEKEELAARSRREQNALELQHQQARARLEDELRAIIEDAQAKETGLREELAIIEERLAAVQSVKAELEVKAHNERKAFEQQITDLESSMAATREQQTNELQTLRSELSTVRCAREESERETDTLRAAHEAELERLAREKESEIESVRGEEATKREEIERLHLHKRAELKTCIEQKEREMAELKEAEAKKRNDLEERARMEAEQLRKAQKDELAGLEEKHKKEIEELMAQEKRMMHDFAVMKEEIEKSINERIAYIKEIETRRQAERQAQDEVANLNSIIAHMQKDFESLRQERDQLEKRVGELVLQNAKLTGHQNLNQKIQHLVKLKQENNSLKTELDKMKKELERTRAELCKFRPDGVVEVISVEERLRKELTQQEELNNALDTQIKSLRGRLSSLYKVHLCPNDESARENEDGSFSFEVMLDQVGLKLKALSQEISDLHFKKLILERENALYLKKSQHGLGFSSPPSTIPVVLPPVVAPLPKSASASSSSSSALATAMTLRPPSSSSSSSHALADVTNFEFNASPTVLEELKAAKPSVHKERDRDGKENAMLPTLSSGGSSTKDKPSGNRSGSRREPKEKDRPTTAVGEKQSGSKREGRETTKERQRTRPAVLQRTVSSTNNRI